LEHRIEEELDRMDSATGWRLEDLSEEVGAVGAKTDDLDEGIRKLRNFTADGFARLAEDDEGLQDLQEALADLAAVLINAFQNGDIVLADTDDAVPCKMELVSKKAPAKKAKRAKKAGGKR
jgi:hypothetical protein